MITSFLGFNEQEGKKVKRLTPKEQHEYDEIVKAYCIAAAPKKKWAKGEMKKWYKKYGPGPK